MTAANLWIVIVNYRTADLGIDCLRSIAAQIDDLLKINAVVVDNASGDGSAEKLLQVINNEGWQDWASVISSSRNGGFAYGNNLGIREALRSADHVDHIMLLNPDTVARPAAIRMLVEFMAGHPQVGIAGSLLENAEGGIEPSAHNAPSPLGELVSAARLGILSRALSHHVVTPPMREMAHECDWVSGASMIIRREVFEQIGLMDEAYFLYFEEIDFCTRARKAGWQIWFVPESHVMHLEGASTGIQIVSRRRPAYWYSSRRRYFVKHFGVTGLMLADMLWTTGRASLALRRLLRLGSGGKEPDPKGYTLDLLWGDFRSIFTTNASKNETSGKTP